MSTRATSATSRRGRWSAPVVLAILVAICLPASAHAGWYNASWAYRKALVLNGALIPGAQTNFPVLVALTDPDSHLKANAQASGNDILFTAADTLTKLDHEIESYNAATGALVAWVRVPSLASGANTTIYMYYGNAGAANQQNRTGVWDASFRGVWHLAEAGATPASYLDSTSNGNNGTSPSHPSPVAAVIGNGRQFDGAGNRIVVATSASVRLTTSMTLEGWIRMNTFIPFCCDLSPIVREGGNNPNDYQLGVRAYNPDTTAIGLGHVGFATEQNDDTGLNALNVISGVGIWYHVVATWDGATKRIFLNGSQAASGAYSTAITPDGNSVYFGGRPFEDYHNGPLDEIRISGVARSPTWIQTEYNNQANQGVGAGKFILSASLEGASAKLKLVQSGTVTIGSGAATATATLNPVVDMTKSFLVFGVSESAPSPNNGQVSGQITATNTVTFERVGTGGAVTVQWYVAEFSSGVSVQRGTLDISDATLGCGNPCDQNVTLPTAVNTARSFPIISQRNSGTTFGPDDSYQAKLTSPTNLYLGIPDTNITGFVEWQVVEYDAASVQTGDVAFASTDTSKTVTLPTAVSLNKSWLLYTYACGSSVTDCADVANIGNKLVRGVMTNTTTLTFDRNNAGAAAGDVINLTWYLVTFSDTTYVQQGNQSFAAADSFKDVTLSKSVSPAASVATAGGYTRGGRSPYNANDIPGVGWFTLQLNKPKNLTISRAAAAALAAADVGWSVVTFPRYEIYGAPALGALGATGCPAGTYRSGTNLIPNGAFATSGGGPAAQPLAASQFTVDPRQTAPAWGWAGDNTRANDTQVSMFSGVSCYNSTGPVLTCTAGDVTRQGAFPGDPGNGLQPTACALAGNPSTPAFNPDYPGCFVFGNGNNYATEYKVWETLGTVGLTAGKTYTFETYASDGLKPGSGLNPPSLSVRQGPNPCTTNAPTIAAMCGGTAPTALHPTPFAVPPEQVDTSEAFNPGDIWTRYQVTFTAAATGNVHFSMWDPALLGANGDDLTLAQVGLYTCDATTAVELMSFTASPGDSEVDLAWQTGSELKNLGFNLYRSLSASGPFERITPAVIPGLGSSPVGQSYSYRDSGLTNGVTYYYELEDIETTGATKRHGPVSAMPLPSTGGGGSDPGSGGVPPKGTAHGDPSAAGLKILERDSRHVLLELQTGGFYTTPGPDGSVEIEIPGFDERVRPGEPALPAKHAWIEAVAGRKVQITSVQAFDPVFYTGLRPAPAGVASMDVDRAGVVRPGHRSRREGMAFRRGVFPRVRARILGTGFQEETKKAQVELSPLRFNATSGSLVLSRRLLVRVDFTEVDTGEVGYGGPRGRRPPREPRPGQSAVVDLIVRSRGLYVATFQDLFGGSRQAITVADLRLAHQGQPVAFHVEPASATFGLGSSLYFLSEGASLAPDAAEAVYTLSRKSGGVSMAVTSAAPSGSSTDYYVQRLEVEQNKTYQSGLLDAANLWLWQGIVSPASKPFPFAVDHLAPVSEAPHLTVWLQGGSDFEADPDHHVRLSVNGIPLAEESWNGMVSRTIEADVTPGVLVEGQNVLEIQNVGDTGAAYSLVFLDRFALTYPRLTSGLNGVLEGRFSQAGTVEAAAFGSGSVLLDTTEDSARWLRGATVSPGGLRFRAEAGRSYLAISPEALLRPEVRKVPPSDLRDRRMRADYLIVGPREFLATAQPLLDLRQKQGLRTKAVAIEDVYEQFGFGEASSRAVRDFLAYSYHSWQRPSPRYVVLLGDATYDPKDYLKTGVKNRVPAFMVKTSFVWTASDPAYANVNGDDLLPDLAIGRLPAANVEEARILVDKIVAFESGGRDFSGSAVVVADNADVAGNFETDADDVAATVLANRTVEKIYLRDLGAATRVTIQSAMDQGPGIVSYIGHGGIAVWASENVWNSLDVNTLAPQPQQPILLAMNCLNGYFHFPNLNSLAEQFVKAEGKGALTAIAPSGLSINDPAHVYHKALLDEIVSGRHQHLGDAVLAAQAVYADSGNLPELLSIYHLFGDPAQKIQ